MKKYKLLPLICCAALLGLAACSDFLERKSQDEVIVKTVTDYSEFLLGSGYVTGVDYKLLYYLDDDIAIYEPLWGEENWDALRIFGVFTWQPDMWERENAMSDAYADTYSRIMGVNAVLDGIDEAIGDTEARDQVKAEALALRGYYYFMLVNLYAEPYHMNKQAPGVPLKLTAAIEENGLVRNTVEEVYGQIVKDFTNASDLFAQYPKRRGNYRINHSSVCILLSRAYLHMEKWKEAAQAASLAIQQADGLTDYTKISAAPFLMPSYEHTEVEWIYGVLANPQHAGPSPDLLSQYKPGDCRPGLWFDLNPGISYPLLKKEYDWMNGKQTPVNTLRISEAYLNRAEAYVKDDHVAEALADLNELRRHRIAGYTDVIITNPSLLLDSIRIERRCELCFDEQRWFDLRRYGKPAVTHVYRYRKDEPWVSYTLKEKDPLYVLPFPNEALQNNVQLEQNASAYLPERQGK